MPVVVVATITPKPGSLPAVQAAFEEVIPLVHAEEGCELYALHRNHDRLVMVERWSSADALDRHSKGDNLRALGPKIADLVTGPTDVIRLEAIPVGEAAKGAL